MKFLVDNALSPKLATNLRDLGHDARHVRDLSLADAKDPEVFDAAIHEDRILITADTDFATLLVLRAATSPSVIIFRGTTNRRAERQTRMLEANFHLIERLESQKAILIFEERRIRMRTLPITD